MIPKKQEQKKWIELRKFGSMGEDNLNIILRDIGFLILPLNFTPPCDNCHEIKNWRQYNKLPDGIARKGDEVFFYDSKAKRSMKIWVNKRDYEEYLGFCKILPVRIFFLIYDRSGKELREVFIHEVKEMEYPVVKAWNGNVVYDLENYVKQLL